MKLQNVFGDADAKKLEKAVSEIEYRKQLVSQNISLEIEALNAQIEAQYKAIGRIVYGFCLKGAHASEEYKGNVDKIAELEVSVKEKVGKLKVMLDRYDEELNLINPGGETATEAAESTADKIIKKLPFNASSSAKADAAAGAGRCHACGAALIPNNKFCQKCGAKAEPAASTAGTAAASTGFCNSCGNALIPNEKFCQKCGAKVD